MGSDVLIWLAVTVYVGGSLPPDGVVTGHVLFNAVKLAALLHGVRWIWRINHPRPAEQETRT